jgi:hypothetical protein
MYDDGDSIRLGWEAWGRLRRLIMPKREGISNGDATRSSHPGLSCTVGIRVLSSPGTAI